MADKFTITCVAGRLKGKVWTYSEADRVIFGRNTSTNIVIPAEDTTVSRFQAKVDIRPPKVYLSDYGSKNGTYLNGALIGQREPSQSPEDVKHVAFPTYQLKDGDIVGLGPDGKVEQFRINIKLEPVKKEPVKQEEKDEDFEDLLGALLGLKALEELAKKQEQQGGGYNGLKILKTLGEGGFGKVYLAEDPKTKKKYAIKEMKPIVQIDPTAKNWFLREASIGKQLHHKNVVNTVAVGENNGLMYIVLEYYDGGSVMDLMMDRNRVFSIKEATDIILQALDGLDYIHNVSVTAEDKYGKKKRVTGLVHRDVKPPNLLIAKDGTIKISDLGLAKAFDLAGMSGATEDGNVVASYPFVPKKHVRNYRYLKPDSDTFAIIASYYFMLTGQYIRDFDFQSRDISVQVIKKPVVPIQKRRPDIPSKLANVINTVLAEDDKEKNCLTARQIKQMIKNAI